MSDSSRVRIYIACSLDGFIAGPNDDLSWLPGSGEASPDSKAPDTLVAGALSYADFMSDVGAILMGRRTHDVVRGFGGPWPYGDVPVLVATHRQLQPGGPQVSAVHGSADQLVDLARKAARGRDVYVDGGELIRQVLDAALVDDAVVTLIPIVLGRGQALFAGASKRHAFELLGHYNFGEGLVQLHLRPRRASQVSS